MMKLKHLNIALGRSQEGNREYLATKLEDLIDFEEVDQ